MRETLDLCYVLSHGFAVRMVLHSDLLRELRSRDVSVALVVPNAAEAAMQALARRFGVALVQAPSVASRAVEEYGMWRRYAFEDHRTNPSLRARHLSYLAGWRRAPLRAVRAFAWGMLGPLVQRVSLLRRGVNAYERRVLRDAAVERLLEHLRPRLLVTTYPVAPVEACFMAAARVAGIPTVSHLLSWDNITTKGRFPVIADYYVTWGPIMSEETMTYYHVPESHVYACGVPHFDRHVTAPTREAQAAVLRRCGLDPERPYLFYGMSSPVFSPREIDVVEWLAREVCADTWGPDLQLVVRPHPQNVEGYMADTTWLPRLNGIAGGRVAVDVPAIQPESALNWNMKEADLDHLANLVAGCAVCLNAGSTLSIDALVHDKPVIVTAFDAGERLPWWRSARRIEDVMHIAKLIAMGGVTVVRSFDEMREALDRYLSDPTADAGARALSLAAECGPADGQASRRVADALCAILDREAGAPSAPDVVRVTTASP